MTQIPCESSLRPDWLTTSFRSRSDTHLTKVWQMAQEQIGRACPDRGWESTNGSRHFEKCFVHPIGARFEASPLDSERNAGVSVLTLSGTYFALSSVYEQMRFIALLNSFKGRYHYTRLDAQVTTLNPSQSAEQICEDVAEKRLWIKGYRGWEQKGVRTLEGSVLNGASACFGAASSDRRATSYNKAAEQGWETPARRDETRLRDGWADKHTTLIAQAIDGAPSEDAAIDAYRQAVSDTIAQHMQYLDLDGTPMPRPKNWARGLKPPKWWSDTLDQDFEVQTLNRKPESDVWTRIAHMKRQWAPTWSEAIGEMLAEGRSTCVEQATFDLSMQMLASLRPEHLTRVMDKIPEHQREEFLAVLMKAADEASIHAEVT